MLIWPALLPSFVQGMMKCSKKYEIRMTVLEVVFKNIIEVKRDFCIGTLWIRRVKNSWESCTHKKAIAFGIFTLAWNLSSAIARIWAGKRVPKKLLRNLKIFALLN